MHEYLTLVKNKYGVEETVFSPCPKMKMFAYTYSIDPDLKGKNPDLVCEALGLKKGQHREWERKLNPYYEEWLEEVRVRHAPKNLRNMLEFVGREKAFEGDFSFWKVLALREKLIAPDSSVVAVIPANLGAFSDWDEAKTIQHRNSLLASLRPMENEGGLDMAPGDSQGQPEGDPCRTIEVPKEPLALPESVVPDGERPLDGLEQSLRGLP
jgi:hypothetical protein